MWFHLETVKANLINKTGGEVRLKPREEEGGVETDQVVGQGVGNEASSHLTTSMSSVWDKPSVESQWGQKEEDFWELAEVMEFWNSCSGGWAWEPTKDLQED